MATREGADGSLSARNGHRQHRKLDCGPPAEQQLWCPLLTRCYFSAVFSEVNPVLRVPPMPLTATVLQQSPQTPNQRLLAAYQGEPVVVWTQPALATTKAMLGADGALTAALVQLG